MKTCGECGRRILGTGDDPVHDLSKRGVLCTSCLRKGEPVAAPSKESASPPRGAAAKARWEAMTHEERAARVAKMRAGRTARKTETSAAE